MWRYLCFQNTTIHSNTFPSLEFPRSPSQNCDTVPLFQSFRLWDAPPTHTLLPPPPPSSTQWPFGIPHDWFHMSVHITAWKTLQQQYIFLLQSVGIHFIRIGQLVRRGNIVFIWCDQPAAVCKPVLEAAFIPTLHCSVWLLNVTRTPFVVSYHFWSGTRW